MKNAFWNFLARFIGTRPALADRIINKAQQNFYSTLYKLDKRVYMDRWWLMPRWLLGRDEKDQLYPFSWLSFIVRIHHIQLPDDERDLHDHPADYRTIILRGWYVEENIYGERFLRQQGETVCARAENFHTIVQISEGGVWTLFMLRKKRNEWGFLVNGRKIPWRKYEVRK